MWVYRWCAGRKVPSFFLLLLNFSLSCSAWEFSDRYDASERCAQLFFQPSYLGEAVLLKDNEQISDLTPLRRHYNRFLSRGQREMMPGAGNVPTNPNSSAVSFRVRQGCNLKLSEETFLNQGVHQFTNASNAMTLFVPKSASCVCAKECKCEDNKLRKSECARAYLNTDCSNCAAQFTTMKISGKWTVFPPMWSASVKSLILRPGCAVSLKYTQSGRRVQSLESNSPRIIHDLDKVSNIAQYRCECTHYLPRTQSKAKPNTNYPPMIDIPNKKGSISNSLMFNPTMKNHPGLIAALQSLRSKKSSKNAYILLLGMTGSGKSSAVNLLFDHPNITKVGDYISTTKDILEFTIPVPVPELGIKNSELHVIDTPGIEDTEGVAQDAKFLASLEAFLKKHEDLKRNLPNIVLIFSKFSDNRFRGQGSSFVKMLRTIDLFKDKIIDKQSTNVIFVLTHYMSEVKEFTKDPSKRIQSIRQTIREFTTLSPPIHIVLAENKPEESQLPSINGFWQLPNGELYPKNLFNQMQRSLNGDPIGEAVIRNAFANSDNFKISSKAHPILHESNMATTRYLGILAAFNTPMSGTEVSTELMKSYNQINPTLKSSYPDALPTLQRLLYMQNLFSKSDLPRSSTEILKLLETIPRNPATLFLLENAFNMTVPEYTGNFVVGSGYSLISDRVLSSSKIFKAEITANRPSDLLFKIPDMFKVQIQRKLDTQLQIFNTKQDYVRGRMKALMLNANVLPFEAYSASPSKHPGFNLITRSSQNNNASADETRSSNSKESLTATVDYRQFLISLDETKAKFSNEFETVLQQLDKLDMSNSSSVENWQSFFTRYGTHVVTHAYGGGSIQVKVILDAGVMSSSSSRQPTGVGNLAVFIDTMKNITLGLENDLMGKRVRHVTIPPGVSYQFVQLGGDHKHYWSNFSEMDTVKDLDEWKNSIQYEPVVLTSRLTLCPISEVVKKYGGSGSQNQGVLIEDAAISLFNASLLFVPAQEVENNDEADLGGSRDKVSISIGVPSGDLESMNDFANMFKAISEANANLQKEVLKWMQESQKNRDRQEQKWEEEKALRVQQQEKEEERQRRAIQDERKWELERVKIEAARVAQENEQRLKIEAIRQKAEMEHSLKLEEIRVRSENTMLAFLNNENDRRTKLAMSQPRKQGGGFSLALDFSNLLGGLGGKKD